MTQIFVSYAHRDLKKVRAFLAEFEPARERLKLDVWMDTSLTAGSKFTEAIGDAIDASDIFLLFMSPNSTSSEFSGQFEWLKILSRQIDRSALIIPILLADCPWQDVVGQFQVIPHAPGNRRLTAIANWKPQREGYLQAARECVVAIQRYLNGLANPASSLEFDLAPAPTFVLTEQGFDPKPDLPSVPERNDATQRALHARVLVRMARLKQHLPRLGNTHRDLAQELTDFEEFLGSSVDDTNVALLWTAADAVSTFLERFSRKNVDGSMVEPVEPDIYALADVLLQQTAVFGQGFAEWRDLTIRKAKFLSKKRGMAERAAASLRPVLAALVAATDVFTERSRHIFKLVADPIASGFYSATDTIDDALPVAINAIGALALNLAEKLHTLGSIGGGIWAMSAIAGDPNMVLVREVIDSTRVFFLDHQDIIGLFANDHDELRRLVSGTMSRLSPASIIAETNQTAAYPNPLPKDFDYEGEAEKLILAGKAPQKEWVPRIKRLAFFDDQTLVDLSPLAGLTALTRLDLSSTGVTDVSPLSGLTGLSELDLSSTGVTDVSPLSGLAGLTTLDLSSTGVTDVSPLSGLTGLTTLDLSSTGVTDVSPLSGLTGLVKLYLHSTGVTDLSPLASLTGLAGLYLGSTGVTDVSPLASLAGLTTLYLRSTGVTDVSPLSGLTGLTSLNLSSTGVTDVSPLSGLTGLVELYLRSTDVADVAPLVGLKSLRHLDLGMTHVDDISALSNMGQIVFLGLAGRGPLKLPTSMPTVDELVLLGRSWPADVPLPLAKYRIDPDGSVHTPGDKAPGWFISWIDDAATFRETGKLPGES